MTKVMQPVGGGTGVPAQAPLLETLTLVGRICVALTRGFSLQPSSLFSRSIFASCFGPSRPSKHPTC